MRNLRSFPRHRARCGATLIDMLAGLFVLGLVSTMMLGLTSATSRTTDRRNTENNLGIQARTAMDEVLREVRSGDEIIAGIDIGANKFKTTDDQITIHAPGFDPASTRVLLPGVFDLVNLEHDSANRTLVQTTVVGVGSKRPVRKDFVLAKNVEDVVFTYYVRDRFEGTGTATFVLNARPSDTSAVKAYVNGAPATVTYIPSSPTGTVSISPAPPSGVDVQCVYTVSHNQSGGAWLGMVSRVDVTLTFSDMAGLATRTVTLTGSGRVRNWPD